MKILYDAAYLFGAAGFCPIAIYRRIRHGRYKKGWGERFGKIHRKNADRKCIWIHAVSVGEVNATKTVVDELGKQLGEYEVAISTTTDTGYERACKLYGDKHSVFHFPLDFSFAMKRAIKNINPAMVILMELEVWPNLASICKEAGIPLIVANGRISNRSFPRYKMIKAITKSIFGKVSAVLAQTQEYADRFVELGAAKEKVIVTNSLKYDTAQITDKVDGAEKLAEQLCIKEGQKLLVAGGTGNDEEVLVLRMFMKLIAKDANKGVRLVIVPRKPERFDHVAQLLKDFGLPMVRYSEVKESETPPKTDVHTAILGDTMGDLRKFYSLAKLIFVGRSLVPMGGSDMAEAAALGKTTIFGPGTFNFNQTVKVLLQGNGAIEVQNPDELLVAIEKCLLDEKYATQIADNGREIIRSNQGATLKTVEEIKKILS